MRQVCSKDGTSGHCRYCVYHLKIASLSDPGQRAKMEQRRSEPAAAQAKSNPLIT